MASEEHRHHGRLPEYADDDMAGMSEEITIRSAPAQFISQKLETIAARTLSLGPTSDPSDTIPLDRYRISDFRSQDGRLEVAEDMEIRSIAQFFIRQDSLSANFASAATPMNELQ
jgi:hypothetical protein